MTKSRGTLNQILSLMTVAFNELSLGYAIGWLAPTLIILQDPEGEFKATLNESSWLACIEFLGGIPGALFIAFTLDIFGRKFPLLAFNELSLGYAIGWLPPTLNILQDPEGEFKATLDESSWLTCLEYVGEMPGAVFTAFALDIYGRKSLLASTALIFFLMWVINALTNSMLVLCIVRFIFGFAVGINDGTNSIYVAENGSPKVRAVFGGVCVTLYYIGLLAEYSIAPYISYTTTSVINMITTFLALLSVLWMKESVQYLLMKGETEQAEKNFVWLHGGSILNEEIVSEFERIKQNVQLEKLKKSSFKEIITSRANCRSLFIVTTLYALIGCTGYAPVMSYATIAFPASNILTPSEFTILFGFIQFLFVLPASFFVGYFNRRSMILVSFLIFAICHATTAILYYVNSHIFEIPYFPWLIFSSITFYASIYAAVFPVIFIIRGELFPLSVKAIGGCLSVICWSVMSFFITKIFLHIDKNFGIEVNFFIFSVFSVLTLVFAYFFLPETKNKTLIEIQEMLEMK